MTRSEYRSQLKYRRHERQQYAYFAAIVLALFVLLVIARGF